MGYVLPPQPLEGFVSKLVVMFLKVYKGLQRDREALSGPAKSFLGLKTSHKNGSDLQSHPRGLDGVLRSRRAVLKEASVAKRLLEQLQGRGRLHGLRLQESALDWYVRFFFLPPPFTLFFLCESAYELL